MVIKLCYYQFYVPVETLSTKDNEKLLQQLGSIYQKLFVLAFENDAQRKVPSGYYLPNVEIKNYVMINEENFFDQPIKDNKVTYENIRKVAIGEVDNYTTGCLLDYAYFRDNYKMSAVDLSRQQALYPDPRKIQQINFSASLDRAGVKRN